MHTYYIDIHEDKLHDLYMFASCLRYLPKGISPKAANQKHRVYMADRLKLAFVNEAAYCLHEGVLREPKAGDLGAIMGIGFPPFTGGPFNYIDQVGLSKIVDDLREFAQNHGSRFTPCPMLVELVEQGKNIYGTVLEDVPSDTEEGVPPPQTEEVLASPSNDPSVAKEPAASSEEAATQKVDVAGQMSTDLEGEETLQQQSDQEQDQE